MYVISHPLDCVREIIINTARSATVCHVSDVQLKE